MNTMTHWKTDISDLRSRACAVESALPDQTMSARTAARCLLGVMQLASARHGVDAMQRACADLARCDRAWRTKFGVLPRGVDGRVTEVLALVAASARGLLGIAGVDNARAAVAFWASEDDVLVWRRIADA